MKTKCCYRTGWTREVCIDVEYLQPIMEVNLNRMFEDAN